MYVDEPLNRMETIKNTEERTDQYREFCPNSLLKECRLCPRKCGVDRLQGVPGYCRVDAAVRLGRAALHMWEEPCISGQTGSGAVFFAGCSLHCVYCQNGKLSLAKEGIAVSEERLSEIFLELQEQKAVNINLVTADQYIPQVIEAVAAARERGLIIPIVWNCSGYESVASLKLLQGTVDIYLTDFKYIRSETARRYSHAPDYPEVVKAALAEMVHQQPVPVWDHSNGELLHRGVIVRYLLLPGHVNEGKEILSYLHETYGERILISIMNQYTPPEEIGEVFPELARRVTKREYETLITHALETGIENGFIQDGETAVESFIPSFKGEGVRKE